MKYNLTKLKLPLIFITSIIVMEAGFNIDTYPLGHIICIIGGVGLGYVISLKY